MQIIFSVSVWDDAGSISTAAATQAMRETHADVTEVTILP